MTASLTSERPGKRGRLIADARETIHRQGVEATTLADIAEARMAVLVISRRLTVNMAGTSSQLSWPMACAVLPIAMTGFALLSYSSSISLLGTYSGEGDALGKSVGLGVTSRSLAVR